MSGLTSLKSHVLRVCARWRGRPAKGYRRSSEIALVVEVAVGTRERDLGYKRARYAAVAIPTYWVIDESARVVHVFTRPEADDYRDIAVVRFGEPLAVPGSEATITLE